MGSTMSDNDADLKTDGDKTKAEAGGKNRNKEESIFLVPYPKIIFFYPAFLVAVVLAVWMTLSDRFDVQADDKTAVGLTWIFLGVVAINFAIITFDFPRGTSLTMFFFVMAAILGGVLLCTFYPQVLPAATEIFAKIRPVANAMFYIVFSVVLLLIYVAVFISVRFNYWEVRPNELLHHHGLLSDLKRYSAPNLRVDKEINDLFEYLLLRSGRLILHPSTERRAIILENVLFIDNKEKSITAMLGALQVKVRGDDA
jgi:hypothetical protein